MTTSIALCTYNGGQFLREQLDSIAQQTLLPDELVACDDRSGDKTLEILAAFKEKAPFPVRIYRNEANLGSTKNFEEAIGLCTGDIIALCDQDDAWKPRKLERLVAALQANPAAGYVFSDADLVDEKLRPLGRRLWDTVGFGGELKERFHQGEQFRCFTQQHIVTGATMAFRAEVGALAMPLPTGGHWIHDGWLAMIASAAGYPGIPVEEPLIAYRQHAGQQIGAPATAKTYGTSLYALYLRLKAESADLFAAWEKHCSGVVEVRAKLQQLAATRPTPALRENLALIERFETHFLNRRRILTSRGLHRYPLIFREAVTGRYGEFSDSWRSMFRDLFL